jgi:VWFA-related protein
MMEAIQPVGGAMTREANDGVGMFRGVLRRGGGTLAASLLAGLALAAAGRGPQTQPASPAAASQKPRPEPAGQPAQGAEGRTEPGAQEQPVFRTGINYVRVDIIATDRQGRPVTDLKPEELEVFEDGKLQTIDSFKLIEVTGHPQPGEAAPRPIRTDYDEESEAAREDVRVFVIVLDDYHVRRGASMAVREPLANFIRTQLGPLDLVGLMYPLTPVGDVRLTRNHEAVIRAIERFEGRKFDYRPRNEFEDRYSMYPAEVVERIRNQVSLSALKAIATRLGGLREGRKAIILVSEGFSNYLPPQLRDPVAELPGLGNPYRGAPGAGDGSFTEDRAQFFSNVDLQADLREVYAAANRANTAIYALDPRGLAPFEYDINEGVGSRIDRQVLNATMDTLRTLADETDGRAIVNRNDLEGGLKQIIRDSSFYYLVGYNSTQAPSDGKFHEIKVRVKRAGVQVRARKGYWALTAEETARALAPPKPGPDPAFSRALAAVEAPSRAELVRTWVGLAPAESGRAQVTFVWEPVPVPPGERRGTPERVSLVAAGGDGPAYFRGKVPDPAAGGDGEGASGAAPRGGRAVFEAEPGRLQVRLAIEDADGRVLGSDILDLEVPDFTAPQVALTTLEVHRARNALELRAINAAGNPRPVATREFRRTDRLIVRFAAAAPGGAEPGVQARLLNRGGQPMTELPIQPAPASPGRLQVDLPLASLPAGEYVLEVSASAAGAGAKQFLGFRVVS